MFLFYEQQSHTMPEVISLDGSPSELLAAADDEDEVVQGDGAQVVEEGDEEPYEPVRFQEVLSD